MSEAQRSIRVTILDESIPIRSETSPEYTRRVAAHVDESLRALRQEAPSLEPFHMAVLGAMEITNDLFRSREGLAALADDAVGRIDAMIATIDEALEREEPKEDDAR